MLSGCHRREGRHRRQVSLVASQVAVYRQAVNIYRVGLYTLLPFEQPLSKAYMGVGLENPFPQEEKFWGGVGGDHL